MCRRSLVQATYALARAVLQRYTLQQPKSGTGCCRGYTCVIYIDSIFFKYLATKIPVFSFNLAQCTRDTPTKHWRS